MKIKLYNNFLENDHSQEISNFVLNSYYKIGWVDSEEPQHRAYPNIHSEYSNKDLDRIKILNPILKILKLPKESFYKCVVNLTKPLDVNFIHVHPNSLVALYYANFT